MYVNGILNIRRTNLTHSEELIKAAEADGFTLPILLPALTAEGEKALRKDCGFHWFAGHEPGTFLISDHSIQTDDAVGNLEDFKECLDLVLKVITEDGCEASGQYIIEGSTQGDVERWIIEHNEIVLVEKVRMSWGNGAEYNPPHRFRYW